MIPQGARDLRDRPGTEALRQNDALFSLLVSSIRDYAIFVLDPTGHVVTWNAGAERIKGYAAHEIIGRHFSVFYPADAVARHWPDQELEIAKTEGRFEEEGVRVRKDGSTFIANVVISPLVESDGTLRGFAKITRDVTDPKHLEELTAASHEMTEFLAMLAHELRNPLAPVRNAVAIMELVEPSDPSLKWVQQVISRQVGHLSRIVDDLLDVSRITRGKITLHRAPLDLSVAVAHAVESNQPLINERRQVLDVSVPERALCVDGDLTRLTQVVSNLLSNAAKYTPEGGRIHVSIALVGTVAELRVTDTGIGMQETLLAKAFNLFAQGERMLARSEGGLGVGLTLVKRLVEMHGGTVQAFSEGVGRGTEIVVRLPVRAAGPRIDDLPQCVDPSARRSQHDLHL